MLKYVNYSNCLKCTLKDTKFIFQINSNFRLKVVGMTLTIFNSTQNTHRQSEINFSRTGGLSVWSPRMTAPSLAKNPARVPSLTSLPPQGKVNKWRRPLHLNATSFKIHSTMIGCDGMNQEDPKAFGRIEKIQSVWMDQEDPTPIPRRDIHGRDSLVRSRPFCIRTKSRR